MKLIRRISFKILVMVLVAGIVGILGMAIMKWNVNSMEKSYEALVEDNVENGLHMAKISSMIYRHQAVVTRHVLSKTLEEKLELEEEERELNQKIRAELVELEVTMIGGERERVYHEVYSNTIGYFRNVDNVFRLSHEGSTETAEYYVNSVMSIFVTNINKSVDDMKVMTDEEIVSAEVRMERNIISSNVSTVVCIASIILTVAVCLFLCAGITSRLEKYQGYLEGEIERKTSQLMEHNKHMLEIQNNTIIGMANLIENRDGDTGQHIKRTSRYVEMLAKAAQKSGYCTDVLTDEYIELLVKAAPMHDIGKIAVPDSILKKPGKLTDEEFEQIKMHAPQGGKIVREVLSNIEAQCYIDIASQVATGHHEKWNGTGYPMGLSGEQIPISARIMAIADVFDALVSKRCYKDAMSADEAFGIIEKSSGSHFDPVLAGLFVGLKKDVVAVMNE